MRGEVSEAEAPSWEERVKLALIDPPIAVGLIGIGSNQVPILRIKTPDGSELNILLSEQNANFVATGLANAVSTDKSIEELQMRVN